MSLYSRHSCLETLAGTRMHKLFQILWNSAQTTNYCVGSILRKSWPRVAWEWFKSRMVTVYSPTRSYFSMTSLPVGFARSQATESCGVLPPRAICAHSFISCSVESQTTEDRWNLACLRWDGPLHAQKHETLTKVAVKGDVHHCRWLVILVLW